MWSKLPHRISDFVSNMDDTYCAEIQLHVINMHNSNHGNDEFAAVKQLLCLTLLCNA